MKHRFVEALVSWYGVRCVIYFLTAFFLIFHAPWTNIVFLISLFGSYALYYHFIAAQPIKVYTSGSPSQERIIARMECLRGRGYYPCPYLINANLLTFYAAMGRPHPGVKYQREIVKSLFEDGESAVLDWSYALPGVPSEFHLASSLPTSTAATDASSKLNKNKSSSKKKRNDAAIEDRSIPVIILFHGLTGGSDDINMYYLTKWFNEKGWHCVIPVRRGCGEEGTLSLPKHYAYGDHDDAPHVVNYIAEKMRGHPILGVGISAGSNVMCNYLGKVGGQSKILAGISISNGYCWDKGTAAIRDFHPIWDVFMGNVVNGALFGKHEKLYEAMSVGSPMSSMESLSTGSLDEESKDGKRSASSAFVNFEDASFKKSQSQLSMSGISSFDSKSDTAAAVERSSPCSPLSPDSLKLLKQRTSSLRQFDEAVSMRLHGYDRLEDFYNDQSCEHKIPDITIPTIFLNCMDDPLAHSLCIPYDNIRKNENTMLVTTASGGHLGWAEGWWPFRNHKTWMDKFIVEGLEALMAEIESKIVSAAQQKATQMPSANRTSKFTTAQPQNFWKEAKPAMSNVDNGSPKSHKSKNKKKQ